MQEPQSRFVAEIFGAEFFSITLFFYLCTVSFLSLITIAGVFDTNSHCGTAARAGPA